MVPASSTAAPDPNSRLSLPHSACAALPHPIAGVQASSLQHAYLQAERRQEFVERQRQSSEQVLQEIEGLPV